MTSQLKIRPLEPSDWEILVSFSLSEEQQKYVASVDYLSSHTKPHWHYHVIEVDDRIVGFFNLDIAYWRQYSFAEPNEFGVRSFFIDAHQQGKGFAKQAVALLPNFVFAAYPNCTSICLTVNCKNKGAYHCYQFGGFVDTQSLYHGGAVGPQHIMRISRDAA